MMNRLVRFATLAVAALAVLTVLLGTRTASASSGSLRIAPGQPNQGVELPLERTDVDIDVAGSIVSATVNQRFTNTNRGQPIEVVYVFPLPQRAAVDAMEMKIGTRTIRASIAKRAEARVAYTQAVREGRRAALLEQERPNIFTFSVGNIDPGATVDVRLHYFEVAQFDHGTYELVVPTTIGPRYIPGDKLGQAPGSPNLPSGTGMQTDTNRVQDASRISPSYGYNIGHRLGIKVHLDGGTEIDSVTTPSYPTDMSKTSPSVAEVRLRNDAEIPNRDFVFRWKLTAQDAFKPAIFAHRPRASEPGYLTLMLEPKHDVSQPEVAPRELFFLVDTSGSMHGPPLAAAIAAIRRAVDSMNPNDTFQILDFADTVSTFAPRPLKNTPENRAKAHAYLSTLRSSGGTNQLVGIHAALTLPGEESRIRYVMFMTDGFIGNDAEVIALTKREIGHARIFSFGVGANVNRYLLDEVAIAGRGYAEYLNPAEEGSKELVERFYRRIGMPYLTEVEVDWGGLAVEDTRPTALPDLSALQPLVLHGRYAKGGEATITIRGKVGGKPHAQKLHVKLPEIEQRNGAISRLWARETIAELERKPRGVPVDADAITRVALAHDLMSRFTSFIAADSSGPAGNRPALLVTQPSDAPADVNLGAAGGVISHGAPPPPSPGQVEAEYTGGSSPRPSPDAPASLHTMEDASPRRGGCAGCTAVPSSTSKPALLGVLLALGSIALRRRRR